MKRMYWTHPDVFETEVQVVAVGPDRVVTDPVIFHPDEGGQPADRGTIGEAVIRDIRVEGGRVVHVLDRPLRGGRYTARLDGEHRLCTAAHHTAQHILSGLSATRMGLATLSVHIGLDGSTVDFDRKIDWDVARDLERLAMEVVTLDLPVETLYDDAGVEARNRPDGIESGVVRLVRIGDYDVSACCGAHVKSTGCIGTIRILDLENHKGGTRVSFLAGRKALEQAQSESAVLRELRKAACCATADLPAVVRKTLDRSRELAKELERLWLLRLADLAKSADVVTVGTSRVGVHIGDVPGELVSKLAGMIAETLDGAGLVVSGTQIAVNSRTVDAGGLLKAIQAHVGGKGGGSAKAANGRLDRPVTVDEMTRVLAAFHDPASA